MKFHAGVSKVCGRDDAKLLIKFHWPKVDNNNNNDTWTREASQLLVKYTFHPPVAVSHNTPQTISNGTVEPFK